MTGAGGTFLSGPRAAATGPHGRRCATPIIWPGLCYTCATGLPRRRHQAVEGLREPADDERRVPTFAAGGSSARAEGEGDVQKGGNKTKAPPKAPMANKGPKKK